MPAESAPAVTLSGGKQPFRAADAVFYHIYPLGCLGAPARNDPTAPPADRLQALQPWIEYLADLGIGALYLGPVFESSTHGYDTADYFRVDRRLGTNEGLAAFAQKLRAAGIRLVFDGVFHHTGRGFWAFRDVLEKGTSSAYCSWYHLDFARRSPYGDPFHYEGWAGHYDLVRLNLSNPDVRDHLFSAVTAWAQQFGIDGLRLDAADRLDFEFQSALATHCSRLRPDFWLVGEVVHGDYRRWARPGGLSSTTNYEIYKGLFSSHNDINYHEIAHSLNRQFGPGGIYRGLELYNFAENHDVDRIASILKEPAHLYPVYLLLLTIPGVASIYYGGEWGVEGRRGPDTDAPLRPQLSPADLPLRAPHPALHEVIRRLIALRREHEALRRGDYRQLLVAPEQFAFARESLAGSIVVAVNAAVHDAHISLPLPEFSGRRLQDVLNEGASFPIEQGRCQLTIGPRWGRVLALR